MIRPFHLLALFLSACSDDGGDTDSGPGPDDTGPEADADTDADTDCTTTVVETTPEDGAIGWYHRDPVEVLFSGDPGRPLVRLTDAAGTEASTVLTWSEEGFRAILTPQPPLAPATTHALHVEVCQQVTDVAFTTSAYGEDLTIEPSALVGHAWVIEFGDVTWTEPEGLGALLSSMGGINPLLLGVSAASATTLWLVAAEGESTGTGGYRQIRSGGYWTFPEVDFTDSPYFAADIDSISLDYEGVPFPFTDFHLEGTFAADGTSFGGGKIRGIGDTRYVAEEYGDGPEFVCDLAEAMGVACLPCADGEEFCLPILVEDVVAPQVPGLVLQSPT